MTRTFRWVSTAAALAAAVAASLWALGQGTEAEISAYHSAVVLAASSQPLSAVTPRAAWADLPAPVQRYFEFAFRGEVPRATHVEMRMSGQFRRPLTQGFSATTAAQTVAIGTPAMMFDATTPIVPGIWARAYDVYVNGAMEMKAKVLSAYAVVDERSSPELDRVSLRRWLLESPLYPMALLPGGPVRWEAIDERRARAVVHVGSLSASLVATVDGDGRLLRFDAEADGDLQTPYHGSGEHVARDDYQAVDGVMVPMSFVIARAAGGQIFPFWRGRIDELRFGYARASVAALN